MNALYVLATLLAASTGVAVSSLQFRHRHHETAFALSLPRLVKVTATAQRHHTRSTGIGSGSGTGSDICGGNLITRYFTMRTALRQGRRDGPRWRRQRRRDSRTGVPARMALPDTGPPEIAPHDLDPDQTVTSGTNPQGSGSPATSTGSKEFSRRSGLLLLATVPLVWGTYAPSVKYLYQAAEAVPGLVFNFGCYLVSVLTFAVVALINQSATRKGGL